MARKVVRLARTVAGSDARYHAVRSAKTTAFTIDMPLTRGLAATFMHPAARALPDATCDRKAMLRGFFLGCGSVNAPSARYHLEFSTPTLGWAAGLLRILHEVEARAGMVERGRNQVVYLKEGNSIVRTLSLMGASRAVMEFEKVRVLRDVSGHVNRRLNFETANIDKTIGSAMKQMAAIDRLAEECAVGRLPPALQEMVRWRKDNPELNLSELAERMSLSKSAINHRLRRLVEISEATGRPA